MRHLLAVLAIWAATAAPALAQEAAAPTAPPQNTAPQADAAELALQDVYTALFFDTGVYEHSMAVHLPEIRQTAIASPFYRTASPERRAALDAVLDRIPDVMREEVEAEILLMASDVAPQASSLMNPDDLRSLANFFRDPQWHDIIQRIVEHSTQKDSSSEVQFSQEETNRLGAFGQTPQGRVIVQNGGQVMNLLVRELEVASPRIQARLRQQLGRDLCEAMGSQCPSSLRQATEGI